jgi:hypothetical protein
MVSTAVASALPLQVVGCGLDRQDLDLAGIASKSPRRLPSLPSDVSVSHQRAQHTPFALAFASYRVCGPTQRPAPRPCQGLSFALRREPAGVQCSRGGLRALQVPCTCTVDKKLCGFDGRS